jgi:hypothetical protein
MAVHMSRYPDLNESIAQCLQNFKSLLTAGEVEEVDVVILEEPRESPADQHGEADADTLNAVIEKFSVKIANPRAAQAASSSGSYLLPDCICIIIDNLPPWMAVVTNVPAVHLRTNG